MTKPSNTTYPVSRLTSDVPRSASRVLRSPFFLRFSRDTIIGSLLFIIGLIAYTITLAPTLLEGDLALFQYAPYVLGVTYPTGFPLYILIGKVWLTLVPLGEIAWRMNFFSALCSASALPLIYGTSRRLLSPYPAAASEGSSRWAAVTTTLTFATLPTFWLWSTQAKTYTLSMLLFVGVLYLLARALEHNVLRPIIPSPVGSRPKSARRTTPLALPALLLGLQISVHNTALLVIPGVFLLVWLHFRQYTRPGKALLIPIVLLLSPSLLYLFIPLRAEWLIAHYGRSTAIEHGLLADFYQTGWAGLIRYFMATDFTGGVATNWSLVPEQFFSHYIPILTANLTLLGAGLGVVGGVALLLQKPRIFWPLFVIYAVPIPFVLAYGQGEQSAFLLPSFLIFAVFVGNVLTLPGWQLTYMKARQTPGPDQASRITPQVFRFTPLILFFIISIFLLYPQTRHNINWLDVKWSRPIYETWVDNLNHPIEDGAAILARWGDLTSLWYLQHAEGRRPDLRGVYPATEAAVAAWYSQNQADLYLAGPLENWTGGIEDRYHLLPWGRLVRIAPAEVEPQSLMPNLPHKIDAIFDNKLRLIGADYAPQMTYGSEYPVTLTWQAVADLPPETTISLRLTQGEAIITQLDGTLLSGWFPRDRLAAGQYVLSYPLLAIPLGTLPGKYRLQLVTYTNPKQPWAMLDGTGLHDLGQVELVLPPATDLPNSDEFRTITGHDFDGEIALADYEYSVSRVGQGKGFAVRLLWQAVTQPADNYRLRLEMVDSTGAVLRTVERQPMSGKAPTSTWQTGQFVSDHLDLVLPANTPPGEKGVRVRLSWLRPDGSKLPARRWQWPAGNTLDLEWLAVTEKEGRVFAAPCLQYPVRANLEDKALLLGYNASIPQRPDSPSGLQIDQAACSARPESCQIHFDFYWQGITEMAELYLVFLHLVDSEGQIIAQHDRVPGLRGKQPTTSWLPREVVIDPVDLRLPADIRPGNYTLRLGMYLPPKGPRLLLLNDQKQPSADFVEVGNVLVTP